jgi:S1-C subfamily serine protease
VTVRVDGGGSGTGWFLDEGYLVTNSHVVGEASRAECGTLNGETFTASVLGTSTYLSEPYHDVAVLDYDASPPNELSLGDSGSLEAEQPLIQVGHPGSVGEWTVSIGKYERSGENWVYSDVPSSSGNSGSPLVTLSGNVVGLTNGTVSRSDDEQESNTDSGFELREEFSTQSHTVSDKTPIIRRYVEQFG